MTVPELCVQAVGMCCAVGHSAPAASAAMGACLDHFQQSWFEDSHGSSVPCAMVHGLDAWGPERMGAMFHSVLAECREQIAPGSDAPPQPDLAPATTALLLLVPDPARPGVDPEWSQAIYRSCCHGMGFHAASRICPWDRAGLGSTLLHARSLLASGAVERVLLAGVDSYLNAITINAFLKQERLLTAHVSDGFIPGEGAGALVLGLKPLHGPCLRICGVGTGFEEGHILQTEIPNLCQGLTTAIRAAVAESGRPLTDLRFHISDGNGNTWCGEESSIALGRTLEHRVPHYPFILPATYFGETGAAVGPLMLAYLAHYMSRQGLDYGLLHCSADNGQRAALLVAYH